MVGLGVKGRSCKPDTSSMGSAGLESAAHSESRLGTTHTLKVHNGGKGMDMDMGMDVDMGMGMGMCVWYGAPGLPVRTSARARR